MNNRALTKEQWRNLYHSFRWARQRMTFCEVIYWIATFNWDDAALLAKYAPYFEVRHGN